MRNSVAVGSPAAERQQPGAGGDSLRTRTRRAPSSRGAKACFRLSEAMNFSRPFSGGSRHRHRAAAALQLFSKLSRCVSYFSIDPYRVVRHSAGNLAQKPLNRRGGPGGGKAHAERREG